MVITVVPQADSSKQTQAVITIQAGSTITLTPPNATLAANHRVTLTAALGGSSGGSISWAANGIAGGNSSVGQICVTLQVVAISQDDPTQSAFANISILNTLNILTIHPASVYAGGANGFTLQVNGSGFVSTSPGPGSTLLIGGTSRITSCPSINACSAPITSSDVLQPGNLAIQVQNPDRSLSNIVQLVVVAPGTSTDTILLTTSAPNATGKDIIVVEPTTAGIDTPDYDLDLNVAAIGTFNTSTNTCSLAGNPIPLARPSSGVIASDICLFSQAGFDTSMSYTISGLGDIAVISKQPAGLGIIHLTLQVPASAAPGGRTLFIQNTNLDQTAASGVLEIQ